MRTMGLVLVAIGIVALLYGGITYKRQKTVLDIGDIELKTTEHKTIPISPIIGVVAIVGGVGLLVAKR